MADSNRQIARSARVVAVPSACRRVVVESNFETSGVVVVKLTLRDRESAQEAVRRFRKLVERSGIKKEMRVREFYEKPSETKRRARLRAQRRARRERFFATH
jgi:small subunit ribosomal protein S21